MEEKGSFSFWVLGRVKRIHGFGLTMHCGKGNVQHSSEAVSQTQLLTA